MKNWHGKKLGISENKNVLTSNRLRPFILNSYLYQLCQMDGKDGLMDLKQYV